MAITGLRFGNGTTLYPVMTSLPEGEAIGDRQPKEEIFTASGTWSHPGATTITFVDVLLVGGGGGGGGGQGNYDYFQGGAGGGGGVRRVSIPVSSSPGSYTVTIGAGGASGSSGSAPGSVGGDTSFGPTAVGGGGKGRSGKDPSTGATLSDAPATGGGGGATTSAPADYGTSPYVVTDPFGGARRNGKGGSYGFPAGAPSSNGSGGGGAGGTGSYHYNAQQGGKGLFGYGGGGSGVGDPSPNGVKFYSGSSDGGGGTLSNPAFTGPKYPWNTNAIPNTGGGGVGGNSAGVPPSNFPGYATGGVGGSGLCVVRWWE